jgi:phosphoglycolate phosphatase
MTLANSPDPTIQILRAIPTGQLKLLVFDLDGTLADTSQDLASSVNATLSHFRLQTLPIETIAGFVGNGTPMLIRRSLAAVLGKTPEEIDEPFLAPYHAFFLEYYLQHALDFTRLYPGARESLEALYRLAQTGRWSMAVLTNKPERPSREILAGLGVASYFTRIFGGDSFPAKKPDPTGIFQLMIETKVMPEQTVMIGDSRVDMQTARNAGVWSLGCAFGFGPQNLMTVPPDIRVTSASAWATVLTPE